MKICVRINLVMVMLNVIIMIYRLDGFICFINLEVINGLMIDLMLNDSNMFDEVLMKFFGVVWLKVCVMVMV